MAIDPSITELLNAWRGGDQASERELIPLLYEQLKQLARNQVARGGHNPGLQATELLNEAYLRLSNVDVRWANREHFQAVACQVMRRVLVDFARARLAEKRGGGAVHVTLSSQPASDAMALEDLLALDQALEQLHAYDPRKRQVVELVYFAGMEHDAIGQLLDISRTTVHRELTFARAFIKQRLAGNFSQS